MASRVNGHNRQEPDFAKVTKICCLYVCIIPTAPPPSVLAFDAPFISHSQRFSNQLIMQTVHRNAQQNMHPKLLMQTNVAKVFVAQPSKLYSTIFC